LEFRRRAIPFGEELGGDAEGDLARMVLPKSSPTGQWNFIARAAGR